MEWYYYILIFTIAIYLYHFSKEDAKERKEATLLGHAITIVIYYVVVSLFAFIGYTVSLFFKTMMFG